LLSLRRNTDHVVRILDSAAASSACNGTAAAHNTALNKLKLSNNANIIICVASFVLFFVFSLLLGGRTHLAGLLCETLGALLDDRLSHTLAERQRHTSDLVLLPMMKTLLRRVGKQVAGGVLDVDDRERARVLLDVLHQTDATQVAAANDHGEVADLKT
jgi:hypothetical protein